MKHYCCQFKEEHENKSNELKTYFKNIKIDLHSEEILGIFNRVLKKTKNKHIDNYSKENLVYSDIKEDDYFEYSIKNIYPCDSCFEHYTGKTYSQQFKFEKETITEKSIKDKNKPTPALYSIKDLIIETKKEVVGQDELVAQMATIMYMHQLKVLGKIESNKNVIPLITGATGTGKTLIIQTMSKLINVPFISFSMDTFTADGWAGEDITDYLFSHIEKENFKHSIIYIDEFDKIHYGDEQKQAHNKSKQYRLLTFIEGEELSKLGEKGKGLNTSNMQIMLSGSYRDFIVNNGIGFKGDITKADKKNLSFTKDDIVKFGLLPELAGRITEVYNTRDLTMEDYKIILNNSKSGYLKYYNDIMNNMGLKINYTESFINQISEKAYNSSFGARDLNNYLFEYFQPVILAFSFLDNKGDKNIKFNVTDNVEEDIIKIQKKIKKDKIKKIPKA
jgi:ATP-dependent Clp protease ATP-binding subunit ClpX